MGAFYVNKVEDTTMAIFSTDYLNPDSLYHVWYEIDEPIFVLFHNSESHLCKDFQRNVLEALESSVELKGMRLVQMECSQDLDNISPDYRIMRFPCLIRYDYEEKGRINSMVSAKDLRAWMENE